MISQANLEAISAIYTPKYVRDSGAMIESVVLSHKEFIEKGIRSGINPHAAAAFTFDIKVALENLVGATLAEVPTKCLLYFDEEIKDDLHLTFVYLHELGHIDWKLNGFDNIVSTHMERETYADLYAYEILCGHFGEPIAEKFLKGLGSSGGWYNKDNEDKEELLSFWKKDRKTWRVKRL